MKIRVCVRCCFKIKYQETSHVSADTLKKTNNKLIH